MPRSTRSWRPGVHVFELRPADVADQRVAPLAAVAGRAPVVDESHREPGVDVRLHLRLPAVEVERGRPAVHEHQHRERPARVVRRDEEPVDALPVRVLEVPRLVRAGRPAPGPPTDRISSPVSSRTSRCRWPCSWRSQTLPSGRTRAFQTNPGSVARGSRLPSASSYLNSRSRPSKRFTRRRADASGHQSATKTAPSRSTLEIAPLAGREIPDPRPLVASTLVLERQPRIALRRATSTSRSATSPRRAGRRRCRPSAGRSP